MNLNLQSLEALFTSDLHFGHKAMCERRGYPDTVTMDTDLITNINLAVDYYSAKYLFVLGDFCWTPKLLPDIVSRIKTEIILIEGNHDRCFKKWQRDLFYHVTPMMEIKIDYHKVVLNHYAMRVWNRHHYDAFHLYGHSHGSLPGIGRSMDVGIDTRKSNHPYTWNEIYTLLKDKEKQVVDHHKEKPCLNHCEESLKKS